MDEEVQSRDSVDPFENRDDRYNDGWREFILLTPEERFAETEMLLANYLALGGSLAADCDVFNPDPEANVQRPIDGRSGLRNIVIRGL